MPFKNKGQSPNIIFSTLALCAVLSMLLLSSCNDPSRDMTKFLENFGRGRYSNPCFPTYDYIDFDIISDDYKKFNVELYTNSTSQDLKNAYKIFKAKDANFCMSLVEYAHPPQRAVWIQSGLVQPYFGSQHMAQVQLLEPLYRHDGTIIFGKTKAFFETGEFYSEKVVPYIIPAERSVDIDNPLDLAWAEFLMSKSKTA